MPVMRTSKNHVAIENRIFNSGLSLEAVGLYCTISALSNDAVSCDDLYAVCKDSKFVIESSLKELVDNGFILMED